jgi:hypothetical protein
LIKLLDCWENKAKYEATQLADSSATSNRKTKIRKSRRKFENEGNKYEFEQSDICSRRQLKEEIPRHDPVFEFYSDNISPKIESKNSKRRRRRKKKSKTTKKKKISKLKSKPTKSKQWESHKIISKSKSNSDESNEEVKSIEISTNYNNITKLSNLSNTQKKPKSCLKYKMKMHQESFKAQRSVLQLIPSQKSEESDSSNSDY